MWHTTGLRFASLNRAEHQSRKVQTASFEALCSGVGLRVFHPDRDLFLLMLALGFACLPLQLPLACRTADLGQAHLGHGAAEHFLSFRVHLACSCSLLWGPFDVGPSILKSAMVQVWGYVELSSRRVITAKDPKTLILSPSLTHIKTPKPDTTGTFLGWK